MFCLQVIPLHKDPLGSVKVKHYSSAQTTYVTLFISARFLHNLKLDR